VHILTVVRDINERGRNLEQVLNQYTNVVKPAFEEFTLPVSDFRAHAYSTIYIII